MCFPLLSLLPLPPNGVQYFHDQLLAFIDAHNPQEVYMLKPMISSELSAWRMASRR